MRVVAMTLGFVDADMAPAALGQESAQTTIETL
jgi:hypothetical protein